MTEKKITWLKRKIRNLTNTVEEMIQGRYTMSERKVLRYITRQYEFKMTRFFGVMACDLRKNPLNDPEDSIIFRVADMIVCIDLKTLEPMFEDLDLLGDKEKEWINNLLDKLKNMRSEYRGCRKAQA